VRTVTGFTSPSSAVGSSVTVTGSGFTGATAVTFKTITVPNAATNKAGSYTFKVTLKKGSYIWTVKATDIAGNAGKASATKKLTVR
jgi:hypothetical protein